jgi:hypothetical protein
METTEQAKKTSLQVKDLTPRAFNPVILAFPLEADPPLFFINFTP